MAKKKDDAVKKKDQNKENKNQAKESSRSKTLFMNLGESALPLLIILAIAFATSAAAQNPDNWLRSEAEQKMAIFGRLFFVMFISESATSFFVTLMLQVARVLNGEYELAMSGAGPTQKEQETDDPSIPWPPVQLLSAELKDFAKKPATKPFFLNHVKGKQRFKDAMMRIGMNMGSLFAIWIVGRWLENGRSLGDLGLVFDMPFFYDLFAGFLVGVTIVGFMFSVELKAGWLHFLEFFQVFDCTENFSMCILWDVVFHINVALNEELFLRGWMLYNLAEAFAVHWQFSALSAVLYAMLFQSIFFVVMHLRSPGGMRWQSMSGIFVGGMAGGLNVLFTGGRLGFVLGWHFGWNISMGNVFGLSTSGIPISATFLAVAPVPKKESFHGGVFGPEGGAVAPFAYLLGIVLLGLVYGIPDAASVSTWLPLPNSTTSSASTSL